MSCIDDMKYVKVTMLATLKRHCCDEGVDAKELGEVADIVKDMCEAEYYCKVTEAMEKGVEDPYSDFYGYDKWPIRSNMYGYRPFVDQEPYIHDYLGMNRNGMTVSDRMGYDMHNEYSPQYGKAYMEYERSRKHYTRTKDENDKKDMNKHMDEHIRDMIATVRQMWSDAEPAQKMHLKNDIQSLLDSMKD